MKDAKGHGSNPRGTHSAGIAAIRKPVSLHPRVIEQIKQNPGGFSFKPRSGGAPTQGYMVSMPGRTKMVDAKDLSGPNAHRIVSSFVKQNSDVLSRPGAHIGGWTDKATGVTHLDISHNIKSRERAIRAGVKRNQIAVWDVRRQREIKTGGSGG